MKKLVYGAVAFLMASAAAIPANAQFPVIDPGNIAQTMKQVQQGIQQLQQMQAQLKQVQNMTSTLGAAGQGIAGQLFKQIPGLDFLSTTTSPLAGLKGTLPGMLDALPSSATGQALGISSSLASQAKTDITSGRQFAISAFYKSGDSTADDLASHAGVRQAALRDSATSGYALAIYTKNDLNNVEDTMKGLSTQATNSIDLRGDVAANTAVELASLRQTAVTNQLLAQLLEVNSTTAINSDSATLTSNNPN